jgi:ABC-type dipeptide/oligopeptide/nickel transport system ATPase component
MGDIMPDPANIPSGCRFHPHCPEAFARCLLEAPKTTLTAAGLVECHLAEAAA